MCRGVEEGRILLRQDFGQLVVGIFRPCERRFEGCHGVVEEGDLLPRARVYQWREEGRIRMGEVERQMLDVMSYPREGIYPAGTGKGVGREG